MKDLKSLKAKELKEIEVKRIADELELDFKFDILEKSDYNFICNLKSYATKRRSIKFLDRASTSPELNPVKSTEDLKEILKAYPMDLEHVMTLTSANWKEPKETDGPCRIYINNYETTKGNACFEYVSTCGIDISVPLNKDMVKGIRYEQILKNKQSRAKYPDTILQISISPNSGLSHTRYSNASRYHNDSCHLVYHGKFELFKEILSI